RETLDELLRTFPLRTCSDAKFRRHELQGRPCLLFHIEKCSGPCVGEVDAATYAQLVDDLTSFLEGDTEPVVGELRRQMTAAAERTDFETAARLRDRLASVERAVERQQMVAERDEDLDVVGISEDPLEASVQVFFVRRGRVVGRLGFLLDKVMDLSRAQTVGAALEQIYGDEPAVGYPRQVLVPELPDDVELYEEFLSAARGTRVRIRVPQRGVKRELAATVERNATEAFTRHRLKRGSDHNSRARALNELQEALGLPEAPLRIECYDMSHLQGTDYVGSMVVLEDGLPRPSEYRRFKLRGVDGNDDFAAMEEVLTRRFTNYLEERERPPAERGRFAYPPQLLLVDGGRGQLSVAVRVLQQLGLADEIPVASLAKQFEEVYLPGRPMPVEVRRGSEALFLLQRIRDESHRFAISYHRQLRGERATRSVLEGIPGLGERRRARLVSHFGGVRAVQRASLDDLRALSWLPDAVAESVYGSLHDGGSGSGSDGGNARG
ncbi:MAG: excinuclease ABC subunit UvrC, partial [Acidobacteria bacterium]|nr:excinuclease ABC subunit UvrC [Acidobacteriota bacterium]